MKFVSIDIETTGLDPSKHQILQVGACIVDTQPEQAVVDWPKLEIYLPQEDFTVGPYCARLHDAIWRELLSIKNPTTTCVSQQGNIFMGHCPPKDFAALFATWYRRNGIEKVIPAGKNFGSFDLQFLNKLPLWNTYVKMTHRTFDPAPYYLLRDDEILPDMNKCLERAGLCKQTTHTALADAICVAQLCLRGLQRNET